MQKYNFRWDMEYEAESLDDAIEQLKGTVQDPDNTATIYTVEIDGEPRDGFIDLLEIE